MLALTSTLLLLLSALTTLVSADFFMSNTTVCMGAFPLDNCYAGVVVLTGTDYNNTYTCNDLWSAQDHAYVTNGTAGPFGSWELDSSNGVCDSGKLHFVREAGEKAGYRVEDDKGGKIGSCKMDDSFTRRCNELFGTRFYESTFRCQSEICN